MEAEAEAELEAKAVFNYFQETEVEAKRHCLHITAFEPLNGLSNFKKVK